MDRVFVVSLKFEVVGWGGRWYIFSKTAEKRVSSYFTCAQDARRFLRSHVRSIVAAEDRALGIA